MYVQTLRNKMEGKIMHVIEKTYVKMHYLTDCLKPQNIKQTNAYTTTDVFLSHKIYCSKVCSIIRSYRWRHLRFDTMQMH